MLKKNNFVNNRDMNYDSLIKKERKKFDEQAEDRIKNGFIPDLRKLEKVDWFYNNVWRDPKYVDIHWMPKVNFVLDIAKKRGGKVIEFGCGCGYLTLELARNGLDATGVDISQENIKIAEEYLAKNAFVKGFGSLSYRCCDFTSIKMKDKEFDTVVFFRSLHHANNINLLLNKINRALKEKGNLIICEPVRSNFTKKSAEFAAILRAVLPTWISYKEKLKNLRDKKSWDEYVKRIYNEYTYQEEHIQSPMDNQVDSYEKIIKVVNKYFNIKTEKFSDAFIDKLIGGLRGKDRYMLAIFLKFLDDIMVERKLLPFTSVSIYAVKK